MSGFPLSSTLEKISSTPVVFDAENIRRRCFKATFICFIITMNDIECYPEQLSDDVKTQILHVQFCDQEITRLEFLLATMKTARTGYGKAVSELLPQ